MGGAERADIGVVGVSTSKSPTVDIGVVVKLVIVPAMAMEEACWEGDPLVEGDSKVADRGVDVMPVPGDPGRPTPGDPGRSAPGSEMDLISTLLSSISIPGEI